MNTVLVEKMMPLAIIFLSGVLVAIADGFIKQASINQSNIWSAMRNPLMIPVGIIYVFAVVAFSFAFIKRWDLGVIGLLQIIIYAAAVVVGGMLFFHERLSLTHGIGLGLALIAVTLLSI